MAKPRILVIYFSQSGQLRNIIDQVLVDVRNKADITYAQIIPEKAWPFPWKASTFFDAMPECVVQQPAPVQPLPASVVQGDYDLVLFGWQPWFLHPSQPITAFLQSESAQVLNGKPVVTVIGCRNMWLNAGEKVKEGLRKAGAHHAGNIVLTDTNTNLVSLLTIIRWSFSGRKEATRWLPAAGVQDRDVEASRKFGPAILEAAAAMAANNGVNQPNGEPAMGNGNGNLPSAVAQLHQKLMALGAISLNTGLIVLEKRGIKNFRFWAKYIREKGGPAAPERQGRVTAFKRLLITAIFILSPISSFTAFLQRKLQQRQLLKDVDYFKSLEYEPGRI